ncbi:toll/interleukin-1 receptor domain-containing protein [Sulfurimonas sp. CS5]|uniref:toll/interleukin-1 receptor domain-containing protein n=1 Tax=Sulfurimonas sp. CS5 TaxID=3391145 RepID=UPI0039E88F16
MLKELSKYNNLGTPSYFYDFFSLINKDKKITEQEIKEYFFNKTIDNRQVFDGCIPLLKILDIINIDEIQKTISINPLYKETITSFDIFKENILESFLSKYQKDSDFYKIFIDYTFEKLYSKTILINASAFKLKYMNIKRFLIDFNFLIHHPNESYYLINKIYIKLFNKYILAQISNDKENQEIDINDKEEEAPKVFISYSWDDENHKGWVLNLANKLAENGVDPIFDRYELQPGSNAPYFMEKALRDADKVLIIFTENYQTKAMGRKGGVGYEYSILNAEICKNITDNKKYIPILRSGSMQTSIPPFMQQFISIYMIDNSQYNGQIKEILHCIFDKPLIPKPKIGEKPDYVK